ncbi:hypothetical protein [Marinoscillum furvescens]|uniref:SprB-like repeat protein n=1 Tax=Marinoscillum furvescens DSM 4134 TaxID=1122208 RepID=A0A3D9L747_MARFU|nr:hypothetical protein [Marinoscillum furvescens]REE02168.1 SprB-like repeat protein [Marinoscillum furvescens DSM 4134]
MKPYVPFVYLFVLMLIGACSSEKESDLVEPDVDCNESDLIVQVVSTTPPGCTEPGSAQVSASGGSGSITYSLDGTNFQESGDFEGLAAGEYTVTAVDGQDCMATATFTINPASGGLELSVVSNTPASCDAANGEVALSASGGEGGYSYRLGDGAFDASSQFTGLAPGAYTFAVKDASGCTAELEVTVAAQDNDLQLTISSSEPAGCKTTDGAVVLSATGGDGAYQYQQGSNDLTNSATFSGLAAGSYTFTVVDGNGCTATVSTEISSGVSLADDVMPIITNNCAVSGCHGNSRSPLLNTKAEVIASASRIKARTGAGTMPPAGRPDLTQEQIDLISCWVDEGADDN